MVLQWILLSVLLSSTQPEMIESFTTKRQCYIALSTELKNPQHTPEYKKSLRCARNFHSVK